MTWPQRMERARRNAIVRQRAAARAAIRPAPTAVRSHVTVVDAPAPGPPAAGWPLPQGYERTGPTAFRSPIVPPPCARLGGHFPHGPTGACFYGCEDHRP